MLLLSLIFAAAFSSHDSYAVILPHQRIISDGSFSTEEIEAVREAYGDNTFLFRKDGRDYIVRDRATIKAIEEIFRPQNELGKQQSELGRKQSELGQRQSAIGAEQSRIGAQQANASSWEQQELAAKQNELARKQNDLARVQNEWAREQNALAARMDELVRKADKELAAMADNLIRRGLAKPLAR